MALPGDHVNDADLVQLVQFASENNSGSRWRMFS